MILDNLTFLGRLHPVLVHLPIGIFILLALVELAGLFPRAPKLTAAQRALVLGLGLVLALLTTGCGWLLAGDGDYDAALLERHRWLGVGFAIGAASLILVRHRPRIYAGCLTLTVALLAAAGHFGGSLTHGEDYFRPSATAKRALPANPAEAAVFADIIHPILEQRCAACHGETKHNGDLRLDSFEHIALGGKSGPALQPGDAASSLMLKRVHLPIDAKEHMPPKGKPQLTDDEVTLLEWWIAAGTPREQRVAELGPPPLIVELVSARLGIPPVPPPDRAATLAAAAKIEYQLGIIIRPLAADAPWLEASARLRAAEFSDADLAALSPIAPAIRWLDLGHTAVTDAGLAALGPMKQLHRLHLDRTAVTDAGLARLAPLTQLELLNLRGTRVSDAGLASLRLLPRLRSLYLWETAVTPAAASKFAEEQTDDRRIARWREEIGEIESRIHSEILVVNLGESTAAVKAPETAPAAAADDETERPPDDAAGAGK